MTTAADATLAPSVEEARRIVKQAETLFAPADIPGILKKARTAGLAAVCAVAVALAAPACAGGTEAVSFRSASYADFRQVFAREAPTSIATISASLGFPDETRDRYPAVLVIHTIGGYQEQNEGWHAGEFRKAGFATLTYDSFAARGMGQAAVIASPSGPPLASAVADAYAALRFLAGHPKIDAARIAIVGFSFGGEIAHLTALERLRSALMPDQRRFAAHVAYYPAGVYGAAAEQGAYTGAPILILLGEEDDNLPVAKAEGYLAYARAAGNAPPIDVLTYPGAYHAWTVPSLGAARFYSQYGSTRKCPFILLGPGGPGFLVNGQKAPFDPGLLQTCRSEGQGYSMAYDASVRAKSTNDTVEFLRRRLEP